MIQNFSKKSVSIAIIFILGMFSFTNAAFAQRLIPLNELSNYFNQMQTVQSDFTQINSDQTISTGVLTIKRPGRMRFDYSAQDSMVIAGGGQVAIFDDRSNNETAERYPLNQTPLSIILERNVDFSKRDMVVQHYQDGVKTTIVAQDPKRPEYGSIKLVFTDAPIEMRQWIVTGQDGTETTTVLANLKRDIQVGNSMFNIIAEMKQKTF